METKEKLLRVLKILQETDKNSPVNAADVVKKLETEYGIKRADRKGVYSDFALIEKCGFNLQEDRSKKKYIAHPFEESELKMMMDAVLVSKCLTSEETRIILDKISRLSSSRGRKKLASLFVPKGNNKSTEADSKEYLDRILEAAYLQKQVEFQYTEFDKDMNTVFRKNGDLYRMSVYSLVPSNNTYYMIVMDDKHRKLAHYRLDRVRNLNITDEPTIDLEKELGQGFEKKVQEYIETSVNHFGGDIIRLVLECKPEQRQLNILYDFGGKNLKIKHKEDGMIQVSVEKRNSEALISWLMEYAHIFKVVSPESVREEFAHRLKEIIEMNNV